MSPLTLVPSSFRVALIFWLAFATAAASAATPDALRAARDAALPGRCTADNHVDLGRIKQVALPDGGGTLYLVPCRSTAFDIVSVAVLERAGALHVLTFPEPGFDWKGDWAHIRMTRISVTATLLSPDIAEDGRTLISRARIPPGLGSGTITTTYRITGGQPALSRYAVERDGRSATVLWQAH